MNALALLGWNWVQKELKSGIQAAHTMLYSLLILHMEATMGIWGSTGCCAQPGLCSVGEGHCLGTQQLELLCMVVLRWDGKDPAGLPLP
jgi:hypothetical protein